MMVSPSQDHWRIKWDNMCEVPTPSRQIFLKFAMSLLLSYFSKCFWASHVTCTKLSKITSTLNYRRVVSSCQHIYAWISYFVLTLKQKPHSQIYASWPYFQKELLFESTETCPGSGTLPLLTGKARVNPADLFGLCHDWIQTRQPWHCTATYSVSFF